MGYKQKKCKTRGCEKFRHDASELHKKYVGKYIEFWGEILEQIYNNEQSKK